MNISEFINIFNTEIVYKNILTTELNCNLYDGIRYLYPGMSTIISSNNVFCTIYAGDYSCFESLYPILQSKNTNTLFVLFNSADEISIDKVKEIRSNVLILSISEKIFFNRIANLNKQKHLQISAEEICSKFWDTVIANKTDNKSDTAEKAMLLPHRLGNYMAIFVVRYFQNESQSGNEDGKTLDERTIKKILFSISQLFPDMNVFYYRKTQEFIIIHTQSQKDKWDGVYPQFEFDYGMFSEMLEHYHLHAGISNSSRAIEHLYTLYFNARSVLDISEKMGLKPKYKNIYPHLENSCFQLIDLAFESYIKHVGHSNIVYLTHPAVWTLLIHDFQNHTDLLDVLYSYITHNCNVSETAKDMFFHRNTILNKLNRIKELTALKLDDNRLLYNLFLSCNIVMYYRDYVGNIMK